MVWTPYKDPWGHVSRKDKRERLRRAREKMQYWYDRGFKDARRGRGPLFRATRSGVMAELDNDLSAQEVRYYGRAYLKG